jgi:hypothetical protein
VVGNGSPRPDPIEDFLLGEQMTRSLNHQREQIERLWLERDWNARALDAVGVQVEHAVVPAES